MQTHKGWAVNPIGKIKGKIGFAFVLGKRIVSVPQANQKSFFYPSDKVIPIEVRFPRINLMDIKTPQIKHPIFKLQIIHFYFALNIVQNRNKTKFMLMEKLEDIIITILLSDKGNKMSPKKEKPL